jgi:hypothetical protein
MKKFKDYLKYKETIETPKVAFNSHGAHAQPSKNSPKVAFNSHGAHAQSRHHNVTESTDKDVSEFLKDDKNEEHLGNAATETSQITKLHELHPIHPDSVRHLRWYSKNSHDLTKQLLDHHGNNTKPPVEVAGHDVEELDKSFTPSKIPLHTYSGLGFNPKKLDMAGKSKTGNPVFKAPTYLSSSHRKNIALSYARDSKPFSEEHHHVLHIETKPGQKIAVIGDHSHYPSEQETTIPRDEHYEHLGSTIYHDKTNGRISYEVHHVRRIPESDVIKS